MRRLELQRLGHVADDVGLRDRLAVADGDGTILVGAAAQIVRHELLARHADQRVEHPSIADAARLDLLGDHPRSRVHGVQDQ